MKHTKILLAALVTISVSSCSVINNILPKKSGISGASATPVEKSENAGKPSTEKKANKAEKHDKVKTDENLNEKIAGEWIIVSADGKAIAANDEMPYITFEKGSGRFYASNGCNVINGSYNVTEDGSVAFDNVLSTMKMCPETEYEYPITKALSGAEPLTLKINNLGHETYLHFVNAKGSDVLTARKHNMDFLNGNWQITSVGGKTVDNEEATIFIDINELKVHGNSGCNYFNGVLYINPDKSNAIDFSNLASTRMACPNMEQESAILIALEETAGAIQGSEGRVMLINSAGKELLTMKPAPVSAEQQ